MAVEIRGEDLEAPAHCAGRAGTAPDHSRRRRSTAEPRRRASRARRAVDRPKAALFGLNTTQVANTIRTNVAARPRRSSARAVSSIRSSSGLREEDRQQVGDVDDVMVTTQSACRCRRRT
jgi:multidrug efflux pump subunit AcrB